MVYRSTFGVIELGLTESGVMQQGVECAVAGTWACSYGRLNAAPIPGVKGSI